MNGLLTAIVALLVILALPALIVLFVGIFITGIGAVIWILSKIGIIALCVAAIGFGVYILDLIF